METIDIIRELLPLLESTAEGSFYLLLLLVLKPYFVGLLVCAPVVCAVVLGYRAIVAHNMFVSMAESLYASSSAGGHRYGHWTRAEFNVAIKELNDLLALKERVK